MQTLLPYEFINRRWRVLIIVGVILLSAALAYLGPDSKLASLASLGLAGAVIALIFLRLPSLGGSALIIGTLVIQYYIRTGTDTRLNAAILIIVMLTGLWIYQMVAYDRKIQFVRSRTVPPLIAFSLITLFAFGIGQLPLFVFAQKASFAAQVGGLALFLLSFAAFFLIGNQVRELRWLEIMTWLFLILSAVYIVILFLPGGRNWSRNIFPTGLTAGSLFWTWLIAVAFSQAAFNRRLPVFWRLALAGLVALTFMFSYGRNRDWTSGWLPAAVVIVVILWVSGSRWFWLAAVLGLIMLGLRFESFYRAIFGSANEYSYFTRVAAWKVMVEIIKINPILGLGPANYRFYTPLFPILGYAVEFNSHNNYLDIIAQTGLLGLACFVWFAWEVWRLGWRLRSAVPDGFARAYVFGALGGLVGSLVAGMLGDWFIPFVYNVSYEGFRSSVLGWIFLGGLLALERMTHGNPAENTA